MTVRAGLALTTLLWIGGTASSEAQVRQLHEREPRVIRTVYFSEPSTDSVKEIYVSGGRVTTLLLPGEVDPGRTSLLGWEGRFRKILIGDQMVVLFPLRDLASRDSLALRVTLADGTQLPFSVVQATQWADDQVHVFVDLRSAEAALDRFEEMARELETMREERDRAREEATQVDGALGTILVKGVAPLTRFVERERWRMQGEGVIADLVLFIAEQQEAPPKVAFVFEVTNKNAVRPGPCKKSRS